MFDLEMIKSVYSRMKQRVEAARTAAKGPLTLAEKILYTHLYQGPASEAFKRGVSYVEFSPDRVAMQDATAQMALLQFMMAGMLRFVIMVMMIISMELLIVMILNVFMIRHVQVLKEYVMIY